MLLSIFILVSLGLSVRIFDGRTTTASLRRKVVCAVWWVWGDEAGSSRGAGRMSVARAGLRPVRGSRCTVFAEL
jgi:hypothetical protein